MEPLATDVQQAQKGHSSAETAAFVRSSARPPHHPAKNTTNSSVTVTNHGNEVCDTSTGSAVDLKHSYKTSNYQTPRSRAHSVRQHHKLNREKEISGTNLDRDRAAKDVFRKLNAIEEDETSKQSEHYVNSEADTVRESSKPSQSVRRNSESNIENEFVGNSLDCDRTEKDAFRKLNASSEDKTVNQPEHFVTSEVYTAKGSSNCPSPQNSFYSAAQFLEAKESFTNTELSEGGSSLGKSGETSIYRGSTGSDISEESSSSYFSGTIYKPHKANDFRWEAIGAVRCRDGALEFKHFRLLKRLGCGDIGSVHLAELIGTQSLFAIKVMDKAALASRKKLARAQTEKEILQSLDHPFLPTLYAHFESENFSCLVMEFCPGGDLHALRQKQPRRYFPEHAARFYVAEVLLALEYLHMLGIIYRDLKPENVLVREDGHIMLSDFDLSLRCTVSPTLVTSSNSGPESKNSSYCIQPSCIEPSCIQPACFGPRFMNKSKKANKARSKTEISNQVNPLPELIAEPTSARSMSFVGTHEYLAPEIIKGEGHGSAVDWWTLGIFLYELLFGKTPFKGAGNRATLFNVVGQPLRFPESPTVSFAARDLIRGLLVKEPQHRLAYRRGATEIKQHPFFQSINWALIRCATPPEIGPFLLEGIGRALAPGKAPGVDTKPLDNYFDMDFF